MPQKLVNKGPLGAQLRKLRLEAGLGVTELARLMQLSGCNITRECLVKIEAGSHNVSMEQLHAFKDVFSISYDRIFDFLDGGK